MIPEIADSSVTSFILDSEVVAYDLASDKILPFQTLSTRAKKGVQIEDVKVQVCLFAFDLLYLNGQVRQGLLPPCVCGAFELVLRCCWNIVSPCLMWLQSLLRESFFDRRETLHRHFKVTPQKFMFATGMDGTEEEQIQAFLTQVRTSCCTVAAILVNPGVC